jgi:hypothetical protein
MRGIYGRTHTQTAASSNKLTIFFKIRELGKNRQWNHGAVGFDVNTSYK